MFIRINRLSGHRLNDDCETCSRLLGTMNNPKTPRKFYGLFVRNLDTHLHFCHGVGNEVIWEENEHPPYYVK